MGGWERGWTWSSGRCGRRSGSNLQRTIRAGLASSGVFTLTQHHETSPTPSSAKKSSVARRVPTPPGQRRGTTATTPGRSGPLRDDRVLAEYRAVRSRLRFAFARGGCRCRSGWHEQSGETVTAKPRPLELPDPEERPFLEVAAAGETDALVTETSAITSRCAATTRFVILSPRELIDGLSRS